MIVADHLGDVADHLVVGLLGEAEAIGPKAVVAQGVSLETLRDRASAALPPASEQVPDVIPFDVEARKALELTLREALLLRHNYIGTEHILLALLELEDGDGVLTDVGIDKVTTNAYVIMALSGIVAGRTPD